MNTYNQLLNIIRDKGAAYLVLIDPDNTDNKKLERFVKHCSNSGVDGFLVGGSLLFKGNIDSCIRIIKEFSTLPVIIFPGDVNQIYDSADAILFLSVISGRNPEHLIGKQVLAAPLIKKTGIEPLSTGYILIQSGEITTAQYMDGSLPVPANKPEIAVSTALAGEYLGMKLIYLEAGSGAQNTVPDEMVKAVAEACTVPVVVGGGIRNPETARSKVKNGAKIIVTGNFFENETNWDLIRDFAQAVHIKSPVVV
ncbi:MAG TPA: geranylgeranylglyceryl/heptaprenylglyceryl phosphate synthase [Ignavibacteriaceae bacterium]|nr:geranylgeranylglyceryl/heptaprenylglyceryl phosphate synthase [Ignavibacteriaceae bacterium]